ncbi:MAG: LPS export ABC transporter periplasmic protein LptC [Candidatus Omnitrophica bacterium]|nr:LPS export ABC transporter periplasmic protein LptC [Candidatus Omnitrophota bacterium]
MLKRSILLFLFVTVAYTAFVKFQFFKALQNQNGAKAEQVKEPNAHKVYFFSFTKYTASGEKEIEIEGDSADLLAKTVDLMNVVAKAYAEETPVTITSDEGQYDKASNLVHLRNNVVATTEDGTRLLTEKLDIYPSDKTMQTDVQAAVKKENINIDGTGAEGDSQLKKVKFQKNVTVVIQDAGKAQGVNADSKGPTVITCDGPLEIDYDHNIAYFNDNVVATDPRGKLTADHMDVYYNKDSRKVNKIVATGNVVIHNPDGNKTYSDNVIYLAEEGRIILGGDTEALYFGGDGNNLKKEGLI